MPDLNELIDLFQDSIQYYDKTWTAESLNVINLIFEIEPICPMIYSVNSLRLENSISPTYHLVFYKKQFAISFEIYLLLIFWLTFLDRTKIQSIPSFFYSSKWLRFIILTYLLDLKKFLNTQHIIFFSYHPTSFLGPQTLVGVLRFVRN